MNIGGELHTQLKGKPCWVMSTDMKVRTSDEGLYAYPDLTVACGEMRFHDNVKDVMLNPIVVIEALSPSTQWYDLNVKAERYRSIESLREYVFVSQTEPHVEVFRRAESGAWEQLFASGFDAEIVLESIGCTLALAEIYAKLDFAGPPFGPNTA